MKLHRFFNKTGAAGEILNIIDEELLNQIKNVLRLKTGERIILFDGELNESLAEIKEIGKNSLTVKILKTEKNQNEPQNQTILYCALLKRENFEITVQKITETGIKEIHPIITERTIKLNFKKDRLEKIIKEAAEQSGRGIIPTLNETLDFKKAVESASKNNLNILLDSIGEPFNNNLSTSQVDNLKKSARVGIFVGPEGGWTEKELAFAKSKNFKIASLGKLTLRAETAAIIASYLTANLK